MAFVFNFNLRLIKTTYSNKPIRLRYYSIKRHYKILFFGSDNIALTSLQKINKLRKDEKLISRLDLVTSNKSSKKNIIEEYAHKEDIKTISWPLKNLKNNEYDVGLIVAFGHLITDEILEKFPLGMINFHPSLLPRWRGAAPIVHTLLHGDAMTGVTLIKIKPNIFDVGEIINQIKIPVSKDILLPELTDQLSKLGANMLVDCTRNLPQSIENTTPQDSVGVTYARKINKSISEVRWSDMTATDVYNLYRAIYGVYTLKTKFRDNYMKLYDAFLGSDTIDNSVKAPGTLDFCETSNAVKVLCKDRRYVYFRSLRIVGKKHITALDFYNGYIKNMPVENRCHLVS